MKRIIILILLCSLVDNAYGQITQSQDFNGQKTKGTTLKNIQQFLSTTKYTLFIQNSGVGLGGVLSTEMYDILKYEKDGSAHYFRVRTQGTYPDEIIVTCHLNSTETKYTMEYVGTSIKYYFDGNIVFVRGDHFK